MNCLLAVVVIGAWLSIVMIRRYSRELNNRRIAMKKLQHIVRVYDVWMMVKQSGGSIADYLESKNIHNIAIYGMAELGNRLYRELRESGISVKYGMDMNKRLQLRDLPIIKPVESDGSVEAVVVTALTTFDIVRGNLEKLGYKNIIALDEMLYELI